MGRRAGGTWGAVSGASVLLRTMLWAGQLPLPPAHKRRAVSVRPASRQARPSYLKRGAQALDKGDQLVRGAPHQALAALRAVVQVEQRRRQLKQARLAPRLRRSTERRHASAPPRCCQDNPVQRQQQQQQPNRPTVPCTASQSTCPVHVWFHIQRDVVGAGRCQRQHHVGARHGLAALPAQRGQLRPGEVAHLAGRRRWGSVSTCDEPGPELRQPTQLSPRTCGLPPAATMASAAAAAAPPARRSRWASSRVCRETSTPSEVRATSTSRHLCKGRGRDRDAGRLMSVGHSADMFQQPAPSRLPLTSRRRPALLHTPPECLPAPL